MAYEFRRTRRVEFAETDCAGIVHFANYLRYMEETEHAFLRSLGLSVHPAPDDDGQIGFPRLASRCEYSCPLRFEEELEIWLRVARRRGSVITYQFVFEVGGRRAAIGELVVVCCRFGDADGPRKVPLPERYAAAIEEAPYEALVFRSPES